MKKSSKIKVFGLVFMAFALSIMLSGLVSAATIPDIRGIVQGAIDIYVQTFEPVLQALFGGVGWSGLYLFERLIVFILLVTFVYLSLEQVRIFEGQKGAKWVVAIVIPLLGLRFMNFEWFHASLIQYPIVAIAITTVLPFLLFFYFVYHVIADFVLLRKIAWGALILVYFGMWSSAVDSLTNTFSFWAIIVSIACLISDNFIERQFRMRQLLKQDATQREIAAANVSKQIIELQELQKKGLIDDKIARREIKRLIKLQTDLRKGYP